jgi:predicted secreted protein
MAISLKEIVPEIEGAILNAINEEQKQNKSILFIGMPKRYMQKIYGRPYNTKPSTFMQNRLTFIFGIPVRLGKVLSITTEIPTLGL